MGQDYEALDGILDHISPMLYRHWQHPQGDACLDREIAWLLSCAEAEPSIAEALAACGFDASIYPPSSYVAANGVLVSHMVTETKLARAAVQRAALVPIYLLEDPHIAYTVDAVKHLCDGVDFYVYHETTIDQILVR